MEKEIDLEKLYFYDPRLMMTIGGRFLVRAFGYIALITLFITAAILMLSDVRQPALQYAGIFIFMFLVDFGMHYQDARHSIDHRTQKRVRAGKRTNVADYVDKRAMQSIIGSIDKTRFTKKSFYLNLLHQLSSLKEIREGLIRMNVKPDEFRKKVSEQIKKSSEMPPKTKTELLLQINEFMRYAFADGMQSGDIYVEPRDLFSALFHIPSEDLAALFSFFEIEEIDLENSLIFGKYRKLLSKIKVAPTSLGGFAHHTIRRRARVMNRAWTARPTKTLDKYSTDITALAQNEHVGFMVGHKNELDRLIDVVSRPMKGSAILVGDSGTGKGVIVSHLAFLIVRDRVPAPLFDKRLIELSIGNLVAGAEAEELQGRMKKIIDEIISAGNIILFIPDLHNLLRTSGGEFLSAADILLPYVMKGTFQIIGATDAREYKKSIEPNGDFSSAFEIVRVEEINEDEATRYLVYSTIILEKYYKITVSYKAVKKAVVLAKRYLRENPLPSSAEDLLKEALADAKEKEMKALQEEDIIAIVERKVNVPLHKTTKEEAESLLSVEDEIHKSYINQDDAVSAVGRALREYRSGLTREGGPIASFLFVGPTGVGKTELSKILARLQFGSESSMIRFDMSEFQEKNSISRFIGSSDGQLPGQLTEAVRLKPFSLILLDEFEKAHPDLLNLFLQTLDDGRLTDGMGNVIDFTNTIIIATSNAHSEFIQAEIGQGRTVDSIKEDLKKMLMSIFRPELLNRFKDIIVFRVLDVQHLKQIALLHMNGLAETLKNAHGIKMTVDEGALDALANLGNDPAFGARPLRRVISERLKSKLANALLQGEVGRGDSVALSFANDDFVFTKETSREKEKQSE